MTRQQRRLEHGENGGLWHERLIEGETQQLAARAAETAGLTLEAWIERAIQRSCAMDGAAAATAAPAAAGGAGETDVGPAAPARGGRVAALLALPLLITAGIAYLATRPAEIRGRAVALELPRQPAAEIIVTAPRPLGLPGDKEPTDPAQLALWLAPRASAGDAVAQYRLGALYAMGKGVERDYAQAEPLLRASAEAGLAEAQFDYGVLLENGFGVAANAEAAAGWYRKAAAQGSAEAALNLGYAAAKGAGVRKDLAEAARCSRAPPSWAHPTGSTISLIFTSMARACLNRSPTPTSGTASPPRKATTARARRPNTSPVTFRRSSSATRSRRRRHSRPWREASIDVIGILARRPLTLPRKKR